MYSSIKKDSLVTAANAKALTETSETTSNTAIFNTTISQSDSDVNSSIHSKEKNNTKFSITEDMSEQERYEELKDKSIVISKPDMSKVSDIDIKAYKNLSIKEAKKSIRRIAEMLGIHNVNCKNSNIKFDFAFSKGSLDTSLNHQREYGGSYTDYAEMLTCLDKLVENAELIEVHKNYKVFRWYVHIRIHCFEARPSAFDICCRRTDRFHTEVHRVGLNLCPVCKLQLCPSLNTPEL